jgi:methionine-rich copper-binding protein CopC
MTGIRCKVIKGKVAVRKMELDRQESSSDESEEIEEKQAKANPKRESRAPNPSPSKSPKVEAKTEADLANLNSIQNSTAADSIHVKDAPEQVKLHSKDQIQFTTAAAELWANTEKLQLKKRELKALKKEREALMKLLKPALDDPLADD